MEKEFFQIAPRLQNQFTSDTHFQRTLAFFLKKPISPEWQKRLTDVGEDAAGSLLELSRRAEEDKPKHVPYAPWGVRVDEIQVNEAWTKLHSYAAANGLISTGYQRTEGAHSRLYQMALLYLFHPSSAFVSCPLAMTDGAARALEVYGDMPELKNAFKKLISNDPKEAWTSGQWMTERTGGSDVGQSQTVAKKTGFGTYELTGTKWFTSATTSQMTMTLGRLEGAEPGSRGLSLFYVKLRDDQGRLQNIQINRLKNKLGTDGLPTAELSLQGTPAYIVGGEGQGIKKISTLFNVTRIYNAICSTAALSRALSWAHDFSDKRKVFGQLLKDQPLHQVTFSEMMVEKAACDVLVLATAELWGKDETGQATAEESALLRLMITLAKLYTGKRVVQCTSEILEMFGGAGYIEDTGFPRLLRDAQVFPIWEGTTNVLSLDVLRALTKECPFENLVRDVTNRLQRVTTSDFTREKKTVSEQVQDLARWMSAHAKNQEMCITNGRGLAFEMTEILIKSHLLEMADKTKHPFDVQAALRFCQRPQWKPFSTENSKGLQTMMER